MWDNVKNNGLKSDTTKAENKTKMIMPLGFWFNSTCLRFKEFFLVRNKFH